MEHEPHTPLSSPPPGADQIADLPVADLVAGPATRRERATPIIAGLAAIALAVGAAVAVNVDSGADPKPLALGSPGTAAAGGAPESADARSSMLPLNAFRYVLAGALPDLGDEATTYRLRAPELGADDVARMGAALDIDGEVRTLDYGGWEISDADRTLTVSGDATGWYVSMWNGPSVVEARSEASSVGSDGDVAVASTGDATNPVDPADGGATPDDGAVAEEPPPAPCDVPVASDDGTTDASGEPVATDAPATEPTTEPGCVVEPDPGLEPEPVPEPLPTPEPKPEPEPYEPPPAPTDLPDANEAIDIARDVLGAIGVLDGADWTFESMDTSMGVAVTCAADAGDCTDPVDEMVVYSRGVVAHRLVNGQPVMGLDWYVDIGDRGVVNSFGGMLADIESLGAYPLRSTTEVFADLESGEVWYGGGVVALDSKGGAAADVMPECGPGADCVLPEPEIVDVTVRDVRLGLQLWYGTDAEGAPVQYVVPSYHFSGTFADGSEWATDLLAIADEYVQPVDPEPVPVDDVSGGGVDGTEPGVGAPEPALVDPVPDGRG